MLYDVLLLCCNLSIVRNVVKFSYSYIFPRIVGNYDTKSTRSNYLYLALPSLLPFENYEKLKVNYLPLYSNSFLNNTPYSYSWSKSVNQSSTELVTQDVGINVLTTFLLSVFYLCFISFPLNAPSYVYLKQLSFSISTKLDVLFSSI